MEEILTWIEQVFGIGQQFQLNIFYSIVAVVLLGVIRWLILRFSVRKIDDARLRYQWQKTLTYFFVFLGLLVIGLIWLEAGQSMATYIGLISAALVVALQDPIANIVGWGYLIWRKPFEVGDRIQIGENQGDVIDKSVFQFTMMEIGNWVDADQSTGRIIHTPNKMVFTNPVANYTKGSDYIWNEIPVLVTYESNWKKAKELLQTIADTESMEIDESVETNFRKVTYQYYLRYGKLTPTVYTSVKDSGVMLTIRYLHDPRMRRDTEQAMWEAILSVFAEHPDIDFAYPTQRFYNHLVEGPESQETNSESMERIHE